MNWRDGLPLLVTSRVLLRELRRADAPALHRIATAADVARYAPRWVADVDAVEALITSVWRDRADGRCASFAVVPAETDEPAGIWELRSLQPQFYRAELTLRLAPAWWETGAFDDALRLLAEFAFETIGVRRIEIRSSVEHAACNAALERMGIAREARLRAAFAHAGQIEDQWLWSVVRGLDRLAQG